MNMLLLICFILFYFIIYMDQAHKGLILTNKVVGKTWLNLINVLLANVPFYHFLLNIRDAEVNIVTWKKLLKLLFKNKLLK